MNTPRIATRPAPEITNADLLIRAFLIPDITPMQRMALATLAGCSNTNGEGQLHVTRVAELAGMSRQGFDNVRHQLEDTGWIEWEAPRTLNGVRKAPVKWRLRKQTETAKDSHKPNLNEREIAYGNIFPFSDGGLDPLRKDRINPSWAWWVEDPDGMRFGYGGRLLLAVIILVCDSRGVAIIPRETLADLMGNSEVTVRSWLGDLVGAGMVTVTNRRTGQRITHSRVALAPALVNALTFAAGTRPKPQGNHELTAGGEAGLVDDDSFRGLVAEVGRSGWNGSAGRELVEILDGLIHKGWSGLARHRVMAGEDRWADTLNTAVMVVSEHHQALVTARNPKALLYQILLNELTAADTRTNHVRKSVDGQGWERFITAADTHDLTNLDSTGIVQAETRHLGLDDLADTKAGVRLVDELRDQIGIHPGLSWAVLSRCAEISAEQDPKRRATVARCDPHLAALGLTPSQAGAIINLLTGSRRGKESALLNPGQEISSFASDTALRHLSELATIHTKPPVRRSPLIHAPTPVAHKPTPLKKNNHRVAPTLNEAIPSMQKPVIAASKETFIPPTSIGDEQLPGLTLGE